jgi:hypothetical protein
VTPTSKALADRDTATKAANAIFFIKTPKNYFLAEAGFSAFLASTLAGAEPAGAGADAAAKTERENTANAAIASFFIIDLLNVENKDSF